MELLDIIRSAAARSSGPWRQRPAGSHGRRSRRALLLELGRAIRQARESRSGAAAVHAATHAERYARYLEDPAPLREAAAVADGERVLREVRRRIAEARAGRLGR
ncbi:MAG TPA: hypothetical protein VLE23_01285 [Geminicoccaceae bacterium]|nr:hypothetical protein [Geminicoccaceae bacterium]